MTSRNDVARAIAFFEACDDAVLLHRLTRELAPRVRKAVQELLKNASEDELPPPADLYPAAEAASEKAALATLSGTRDFALLQALARSIGRRIEAIEIVASAEFDEGTRVNVPVPVAFPPGKRREAGVVKQTGTTLQVALDNGESWSGPPSLATKEGQ